MKWTLRKHAVLIALAAAPAWALRAAAQCAMCAQSAEAAGSASGDGLRSLLIGALILLVPVLLMLGGGGYLVWKHRHADGAFSGRGQRTPY